MDLLFVPPTLANMVPRVRCVPTIFVCGVTTDMQFHFCPVSFSPFSHVKPQMLPYTAYAILNETGRISFSVIFNAVCVGVSAGEFISICMLVRLVCVALNGPV